MGAWVAAGQAEDAFWRQTPRTFSAVMGAIRRREKREAEAALGIAHATAAFSRAKKLEPLARYLGNRGRQSPREMLAILRGLNGAGAAMTFTREG